MCMFVSLRLLSLSSSHLHTYSYKHTCPAGPSGLNSHMYTWPVSVTTISWKKCRCMYKSQTDAHTDTHACKHTTTHSFTHTHTYVRTYTQKQTNRQTYTHTCVVCAKTHRHIRTRTVAHLLQICFSQVYLGVYTLCHIIYTFMPHALHNVSYKHIKNTNTV